MIDEHNTSQSVQWIYRVRKRIILWMLVVLAVSMGLTVALIVGMLRSAFIAESAEKTTDLAYAIKGSLRSMMLARQPGMIRNTVEAIGTARAGTIERVYLLDRNGRVAYATNAADTGVLFDRARDSTCTPCHRRQGVRPQVTNIELSVAGSPVQRNVLVIRNEAECAVCHKTEPGGVIGKLIIDRPLGPTYAVLGRLEMLVLASGVVSFLVVALILYALLDRYIREIVRQDSERAVLTIFMKRLSNSIYMDELKGIVGEIFCEALGAQEVLVLSRKGSGSDYSMSTWDPKEGKVYRKRLADDDPSVGVINRWLEGGLWEVELSKDAQRYAFPLGTPGGPSALIIAARAEGVFDRSKEEFLRILLGHISMSFENARLYHLAITDELTQLYTLRHFRFHIERKLQDHARYGEPFVLALIDVDRFKSINDTYGHPAGDQVLRELAARIIAIVREHDFAFRYGGEEFGIMLQNAEIKGGQSLAERLRQSIEATPFEVSGHKVRVTVSIGLAECPAHATASKDLIALADAALYAAKRSGRNRVVIAEPGQTAPAWSGMEEE